MNYNSSKNQTIKDKFVSKYVYQCQTSLIDEVLKAGWTDNPINDLSWDDVENNLEFREVVAYDSGFAETYDTQEEIDERIETLREKADELELKWDETETMEEANPIQAIIDKIEEEIEELEDLKSSPKEIFEWWLVDRWLYKKLSENSEAVLTDGQSYWWGRCTTGQAILLDHAISVICEEMGILEGQENEW